MSNSFANHAGFTSFRWARGASILRTSSDLGDRLRLLGGLEHLESLAIEPNLKKAADRSVGAIHQESVYGAGGRLVKTNPWPKAYVCLALCNHKLRADIDTLFMFKFRQPPVQDVELLPRHVIK